VSPLTRSWRSYLLPVDGSEFRDGSGGGWVKANSQMEPCSNCAFQGHAGLLFVDVGAGRVLVNKSSMQPCPKKFLTEDFTDFFGAAVPNCVITSDRIHCTQVQLWHQQEQYRVECWSPASRSASLSPGVLEGHFWGSGVMLHEFAEPDNEDEQTRQWTCNRDWGHIAEDVQKCGRDVLMECSTEKVYAGTHSFKIHNRRDDGDGEYFIHCNRTTRVKVGVPLVVRAQIFCTSRNTETTNFGLRVDGAHHRSSENARRATCKYHGTWEELEVIVTPEVEDLFIGCESRGKQGGIGPCYIDQIIVDEIDKTHLTQLPSFELGMGECITHVSTAHSVAEAPEGHTLRGLLFITNKGRVSLQYGTFESTPDAPLSVHSVDLAGEGRCVVGFQGYHGEAGHKGVRVEGGDCDGRGVRCIGVLTAPGDTIPTNTGLIEESAVYQKKYLDGEVGDFRRQFSDRATLVNLKGWRVKSVSVASIASMLPSKQNLCIKMIYTHLSSAPEMELSMPVESTDGSVLYRGLSFHADNCEKWTLPGRLPWLGDYISKIRTDLALQGILRSDGVDLRPTVLAGQAPKKSSTSTKKELGNAGEHLANDENPLAADRLGVVLGPMLTVVSSSDTSAIENRTPQILQKAKLVALFVINGHQTNTSEAVTEACVSHVVAVRESLRAISKSHFEMVVLIHSTKERTEWSKMASMVAQCPIVPYAETIGALARFNVFAPGVKSTRSQLVLVDRVSSNIVSEPDVLLSWMQASVGDLVATFPWENNLRNVLEACECVQGFNSDPSMAKRLGTNTLLAIVFVDDSAASLRILNRLVDACPKLRNPPHVVLVPRNNSDLDVFRDLIEGKEWIVISPIDALRYSLRSRLRVTTVPGVALINGECELLNPNAVSNVDAVVMEWPWYTSLPEIMRASDVASANDLQASFYHPEVLMPDFDVHGKRMLNADGSVCVLLQATMESIMGGMMRRHLELRVLPHRKVVQLFVLEESGRRVYRRQLLSTSGTFSLANGNCPAPNSDGCVQKLGRYLLSRHQHVDRMGLFAASPVHYFGRSVVITRERDQARIMPERFLDGLLPAHLVDSFRFFNLGDSILGEPHKGSSLNYTLHIELSPLTDEPVESRWLGAKVKRHCTKGGPTMILLDLLQQPTEGSLLWRLASTMTRLDCLSHVLAWATEADGLVLVELPRIGTSFKPRPGPHGERWLWNCDLPELALAEDLPHAIMDLVRGLPHSIVLRDREGKFCVLLASKFLELRAATGVLPNWTVERHNDEQWLQLARSRYFLLTVHTSRMFLECDSLCGQLYYTWCLLSSRRYAEAARSVELCQCDRALQPDELFVLSQFDQGIRGAFKKDPKLNDVYAKAVRLKLASALAMSGAPMPFLSAVGFDVARIPSELFPTLEELRLLPRPKFKGEGPLSGFLEQVVAVWPGIKHGYGDSGSKGVPVTCTTKERSVNWGGSTASQWFSFRNLPAGEVKAALLHYREQVAAVEASAQKNYSEERKPKDRKPREWREERERCEAEDSGRTSTRGMKSLTYKRPVFSADIGPAYSKIRLVITRTATRGEPPALHALKLMRWFGGSLVPVFGAGSYPRQDVKVVRTSTALYKPKPECVLHVPTTVGGLQGCDEVKIDTRNAGEVHHVSVRQELCAGGLQIGGVSMKYRYRTNNCDVDVPAKKQPYFELQLCEHAATGSLSRPVARYVKIQGARQEHLHISTMEVYNELGENVALISKGCTASASSIGWDGSNDMPIDGGRRTRWPNSNHTHKGDNEWWEVDLKQSVTITRIVVINRIDGCHERLSGAQIVLKDKNKKKLGIESLRLSGSKGAQIFKNFTTFAKVHTLYTSPGLVNDTNHTFDCQDGGDSYSGVIDVSHAVKVSISPKSPKQQLRIVCYNNSNGSFEVRGEHTQGLKPASEDVDLQLAITFGSHFCDEKSQQNGRPDQLFAAGMIYGGAVKLQNLLTRHRLHSHSSRYPESCRQQVTCHEGNDDNDFWRIKGAHGKPDPVPGTPVLNGDVIRLEHCDQLGRHGYQNLHAVAGRPSHCSGPTAFEVSADGGEDDDGEGDANDNWKVIMTNGESAHRPRLQFQHEATTNIKSSGGRRDTFLLCASEVKYPGWGHHQGEIVLQAHAGAADQSAKNSSGSSDRTVQISENQLWTSKNVLNIKRAWYGIPEFLWRCEKGIGCDATPAVKAALGKLSKKVLAAGGKKLSIKASNELFSDPAPGRGKVLIVVYESSEPPLEPVDNSHWVVDDNQGEIYLPPAGPALPELVEDLSVGCTVRRVPVAKDVAFSRGDPINACYPNVGTKAGRTFWEGDAIGCAQILEFEFSTPVG
jgi:hypothetical protein